VQRKQWEGRVIEGRFHLRQYLGGSPHSAVFGTEFGEEAPRKAAIKLVAADSGKADAWVLRRELAARLSHPGLLSILQFGTCRIDDAVFAYAVMEPSDEDLSQVIPTRPLTAVEARELLLAVAEILAYVHAEGFVHGRLTPANLMAAGDRIKISSDGLLRAGESSGDLWAPDANDPPESRAGVTPAGDVWWLGMTLVEALTQRAPAWDRTRGEDPAVPETLGEPFRGIARRCLRPDPRLRCSLAEVSLALQPNRPAPPARSRVVRAVPAAKPAAPAAGKKRKYLLPVAASVLAGVVATGAILTGLRLMSPSPGTGSHPPEPAAAQGKPGTAPAAPMAGEVAPGGGAAAGAGSPAPIAGEAAPSGGQAAGAGASTPLADESAPRAGGATPAAPVPIAPEAAPGGGKAAHAGASTPPANEPAPRAGGGTPAAPAALPSAGGSAGDVVARSLPEVPPQILATIRGSVTVSVRVRIGGSGDVVDAALDSRPGSRYFDRVSLEAARRWKFKSASDGQGPEGGVTRLVRFEFRRQGCVASSGGAPR